jgi:glycosyltransferase involved in cell wall biosynthesis
MARKQQFMRALSKREDVARVVYIEPPENIFRLIFNSDKTPESRARKKRALGFKCEQLTEKLLLFTPVFFLPGAFRNQCIYDIDLFLALLVIKMRVRKLGIYKPVIWLYHPCDYRILRWFKDRAYSVFDWAEEWGEYFIELSSRRRKQVIKLEEKIISGVDLVFVVSDVLLEKAKKCNFNSHRLLDGTVYELFQKASFTQPQDMMTVKKPALGYLGSISERVDIGLLETVAKTYPDCSLVLVGDIHEGRTDVLSLRRYSNIIFTGGKDFDELGDYVRSFDVCLLPYRPELTSSFPTKLFDYFATGKPVVCTELKEVLRFKEYLYLAATKEEFIGLVEKALGENNQDLTAARKEIAKNNTWEKRAEEIVGYLQDTD